MASKSQKKRDKKITREIHRLYWESILQRPIEIIVCFIFRLPAFVLIHTIMPLVIAYAIEDIFNKNYENVVNHVWQLVLVVVSFCICWAIAGIVIPRHGVAAGAYIQRKVFNNFLEKDYEFYTNTYFGSLGAQAIRLRESLNNQYIMIFFNQLPKISVIVVGGILVIALNSLLLALVTVVTMSAVLSFTIFSGKWRLNWRKKVSESNSSIAGKIGDALTHATAVKSFATENYEEARIKSDLKTWEHAQYVSWALNVPSDVVRYLLIAIATSILLIMTANMYIDGKISIAIVAVVQLYVIKLIAVTVDISDLIKTYEQAMGDAYEPVKTMLIEPKIKDPDNPIKLPDNDSFSLNFENVTFKYGGAKNKTSAVKNFNVMIAPGEKVGIVGYSGGGKTTLTKLLLRFEDTDKGKIKISNIDIKTIGQKDLRRHIAYVPQEPILFHRTIAENIAYGKPDATKNDINLAAKSAFVDEFVNELPEGFNTLVGERGIKLSGGQRQRVAIARAILKNAPILVLDEATSSLDSRSEQLIQKALWELMKDRTALVIAHRLSTIQRMDRIVVMDKGKVVQEGSHDELLKQKSGIYAELWAHQSGGYIGLPTEQSDE